MISLKTSYEPIKDKAVNGGSKMSSSIKKSSSLPGSESSAGADDSLGSIASDEISPKRLRRSSSRSLSPQTHRSSSERSKRIKPEEVNKVCTWALFWSLGIFVKNFNFWFLFKDSRVNNNSNYVSEKSHKSSRDHDKEKKDHRKREHSTEVNESHNQQKRSKSDEKKKWSPSKRVRFPPVFAVQISDTCNKNLSFFFLHFSLTDKQTGCKYSRGWRIITDFKLFSTGIFFCLCIRKETKADFNVIPYMSGSNSGKSSRDMDARRSPRDSKR